MFVLLEHRTLRPPGVHWDLLVELPDHDLLPTWRLTHDPTQRTDDIPAERIADHRRLYLDYEGEIAGDRGEVRRVDRGEAEVSRLDPTHVVLHLAGKHLCGRFEIGTSADGCTVFRPGAGGPK